MRLSRQERDRAVQDPEEKAYREMRKDAENEMNPLAPPTQISNEIAKGETWLGNTGRFIAGCHEMGGVVEDKHGNTVMGEKHPYNKNEIDYLKESHIDEENGSVLVCRTEETDVAVKTLPGDRDEILMAKVQDDRAKEYMINPDIEAQPNIKGVGISSELTMEARQGTIQVREGSIREIDRPEHKVSSSKAQELTDRENPEDAEATLDYQVRIARGELDKVNY